MLWDILKILEGALEAKGSPWCTTISAFFNACSASNSFPVKLAEVEKTTFADNLSKNRLCLASLTTRIARE